MWSNETEAGYIIYRESNVWFDDLLLLFFSETTFFFWDKAGIIKNFIILITNMWIFYKKKHASFDLCACVIVCLLFDHSYFTTTHGIYIFYPNT